MAARNLGLLRQSVENLGVGADLASAINDHIATEWRNLCGMRQWKWLEEVTTQTLAINATSVSLATISSGLSSGVLRSVQSVRATDAQSTYYHLEYITTQKFLELQQEYPAVYTQGSPRYWTLLNQAVNIWPAADQTYTLTIQCIIGANTLVADSDVPTGLPADYDDILVWSAAMRLYARQNNWIEYGNAQGRRQEIMSNLEANDSMQQRQKSDEVERTGIWGASLGSRWW